MQDDKESEFHKNYKDYEPFNSMLKLIKKFDGLRIYRLNERNANQVKL